MIIQHTLYGNDLINNLETVRADIVQESERQFAQDLDDCFISYTHSKSQLAEIDLKLQILRAGGLHEFSCLRDSTTNEVVSSRIIEGKFGPCHLIDNAYQGKFGCFVGLAKRAATYAKKGLTQSTVALPAWVKLNYGSGKGLAAAVSVQPVIFPSDRNYFTGELV